MNSRLTKPANECLFYGPEIASLCGHQEVTDMHSDAIAGKPLQTATQGFGPLVERRYIGEIIGAKANAQEIVQLIARDLPLLVDKKYATFHFKKARKAALSVGDEIGIKIRFAGYCQVTVSQIDATTMTLVTEHDHPEAGRISFHGSDSGHGSLFFEIRSRARSANFFQFVGYLLLGKYMQTKLWVRLIENVADALNGRITDEIKTTVHPVEEKTDDRIPTNHSTFETPR